MHSTMVRATANVGLHFPSSNSLPARRDWAQVSDGTQCRLGLFFHVCFFAFFSLLQDFLQLAGWRSNGISDTVAFNYVLIRAP